MSPGEATAMIDRQMVAHGRNATLRLSLGTTPPTYTDVAVKAMVRNYDGQPLVGALQQGDRRAILRNTELAAGSHRAPRVGDRLVVAGVTYTVQDADARAVGDTIVSHWLTIRG